MTTLLFDLDGTLVDSSPGILAAFRHSFAQMNWPCPNQAELMTFIGPPLEITFTHYSSDQEAVEAAIAHFRGYYNKTGLYKAEVYSGVKDCLAGLKAASHQLFVATSKNEPMAVKMLENLKIALTSEGLWLPGKRPQGRCPATRNPNFLINSLSGRHDWRYSF